MCLLLPCIAPLLLASSTPRHFKLPCQRLNQSDQSFRQAVIRAFLAMTRAINGHIRASGRQKSVIVNDEAVAVSQHSWPSRKSNM